MPANLRILDVLLLAPRLLQFAIVIRFLRMRWYKELPFFFAYTVSELLQILILVPLYHQPNNGYPPYFYISWSFTACSTALRFAVIYEVFHHLVNRYEAFRLLGRTAMRWSLLVLLLLGIMAAAYAPNNDSSLLLHRVMLLKTVLTGIQCGLWLVLFVFAWYFRVSWPHRVFGIAAGFAVYVSYELALTALRAQLGMAANVSMDYAESLGYGCVIAVWAYYLLLPEPVMPDPPSRLPDTDLEKWNETLLRLLQR